METRIIKAVFGASKSIVAPKRFKNDWGQVLELVGIELPQTFEAHFSNSRTGTAKKRVGQDNRVDVPAEYFESGADIFCWVMVHDAETDGRTMYTVRIPIEERADVTDVEPTPVEQDVITQAIAALNSAVEKTAQDVESADASAQSAKADADRAETARDTAEGYVDDVQGYAQQAQASADSAAFSATSSASSASQAQQIKTDVQGLVSDAQSAAGASAQFALESAQSASQASASATSASQSAETASTKASEASASAQTAGAKATEASGYASTASAKASESSQSASAASGYATQAGQAKTAAETAQGLAEQAQSDAESAKDDAESARDEAQQIVNGISGKVEQIDQNTADIASLEADRYKAYATDTATGAVASFPDGADNIPMADVKVNIDPVQDLHGYDNPWPAGGKGNLFQTTATTKTQSGVTWTVNADGSVTASGTATGYTEILVGEALVAGLSGTVTLYGDVNYSNNVIFGVITLLNSNASVIATIYGGGNDRTHTIDLSQYNDAQKIQVSLKRSNNSAVSGTYHIQVIEGSTVPTWYPYSNICPISGWDGAQITVADTTPIEGAYVFSPIQSGIGTPSHTNVRPILPGLSFERDDGTIFEVYGGILNVNTRKLTVDRAMIDLGTLTWNKIDDGSYFYTQYAVPSKMPNNSNIMCDTYKNDGIYNAYNDTNFPTDKTIKSSNSMMLARVCIRDDSYTDADTFKTAMSGVQLVYELAEPVAYQLTASEVQRALTALGINGSIYPITFPSEAGTVYGCTLDVTIGVLTVDRAMVDLGTLDWYEVVYNNIKHNVSYNLRGSIKPTVSNAVKMDAVCSEYAIRTRNELYIGTFPIGIATDTSSNLWIVDPNFSTALLSGVQLCYELAEPIHYTLDPVEIRSLLGVNNVFADTGDSTAEYRADTKLYIQKKIAEAISALS